MVVVGDDQSRCPKGALKPYCVAYRSDLTAWCFDVPCGGHVPRTDEKAGWAMALDFRR